MMFFVLQRRWVAIRLPRSGADPAGGGGGGSRPPPPSIRKGAHNPRQRGRSEQKSGNTAKVEETKGASSRSWAHQSGERRPIAHSQQMRVAPAEERRLIARIKRYLLFKRGAPGSGRAHPAGESTPEEERRPSKRREAPPFRKEEGRPDSNWAPQQKRSPIRRKWVPLAGEGRPRQWKGPSRREWSPAGEGRPQHKSRRMAPQQKRGATAKVDQK